MPAAFFILTVFELLGELLQAFPRLPIPGPVIGMFLLALVLIVAETNAVPAIAAPLQGLQNLSHFLLSWMGLFFVPAGVGLLAEGAVFAREWLPIMAGVAGSTVISLSATGLAMQFFLQVKSTNTDRQPKGAVP